MPLLLFTDFFREKYLDEIKNVLSPQLRRAVEKTMRLFAANPKHPSLKNHPLAGGWQNFRSIYVSDQYRIFFTHDGERVILHYIVKKEGQSKFKILH